MVANCVAYGCTNVYSKNPNIQFHTFPFKRPEILKLWISAVRRENWEPSRTARLCSQHFKENDYQKRPGASLRLLKMDAVPSVFNFPNYLQKHSNNRRVLRYKNEKQMPSQEVENMKIDGEIDQISNQADAETQTNNTDDAEIYRLRRKVKTLNEKVRRRDKKISSMKQLIEELKRNQCTTDNLTIVMENYFEGFPLELLVHQFENKRSAKGQRRYSELMKQFAHTLYFYSPKAYNFVRKHFILPNPRTIRKWLSGVNCYPGFLGEVMGFLKMEVAKQPCLSNCALIIDAISIRKQIIWDNVKGTFVGNVDFGGMINIDRESPASEALFFQIVSYTNKYKCPVGYFLIDKTDANVQNQLIICCLRNLYEIGIVVRSITCDGTATNLKTYQNLGCVFNIIESSTTFKPHFTHPSSPNVRVHCIMDACHMIKLARNCMAERSLASEAGCIKWEFIKSLHNIQSTEQLRLANSLSSSHIHFKNKIMNVRLAAQTLSSSVANALEYLEKERYLNFDGCGATIEFINTVDKIFDILNARSPFGKGYKSPIRPESLDYIQQTFNSATTYLRNLKIDGTPILMHARKTFALGFIITMSSIIQLAKDLFNLDVNPLKYFLPYKCSQDHLEVYFSCIRSRGGWNNNPNVLQLRWALRQLLFKNAVKCSSSSNCLDFDAANDLSAFEFQNQNRITKENELDENDKIFDDTMFDLINYSLNDYKENVLYYISGYVAKKVAKKTVCIDCVNILFHCEKDIRGDHTYTINQNESFKRFTNFTTNGGLLFAANIVFRIIQFVEMYYRHLIETISLKDKNFRHLLQNAAKHKFSSCLHLFQPTHPVGCEEFLSDLHELELLKRIVNEYLKCRMPHHAKLINEKIHGKDTGIRQKLTKLILFHNL